MKNINDYKGTRTAIHCKTQEQWDWVTKELRYKWNFGRWDEFKEESCINASLNSYVRVSYYVCKNYTIIPASDFMPTPRTIEQIETELEVLRNELKLIKAQTPKKKIEFVKHLNSSMVAESDPSSPESWENIKVLCSYNTYDIMKAWDDNDDSFAIFLGHFNDGIK